MARQNIHASATIHGGNHPVKQNIHVGAAFHGKNKKG
jgi:hypothetical protein